jgi:hypothetical protein
MNIVAGDLDCIRLLFRAVAAEIEAAGAEDMENNPGCDQLLTPAIGSYVFAIDAPKAIFPYRI